MQSPMPIPRPLQWAQCVLFILLIALPLVGWVVGWDPAGPTSENRRLAPPPRMPRDLGAVARLPAEVDAYWSDHFGFRQSLIASHGLAMLRLLAVSPTPDVILGRDGWLFYGGEGALDAFRSTTPMSPEELSTWVGILEQWQRSLASLGIGFIVAVAPEKQSIYPDMMPPAIRPWSAETRYDQLAAALARRGTVTFLDLRGPMREVRAREPAYFKWDTHWTAVGAHRASLEVLRALKRLDPTIPTHRLAEYARVPHPVPGDLVRLLGLRYLIETGSIELVPGFQHCLRRVSPPAVVVGPNLPDDKRPFAVECPGGPRLRVLMLHDSFGLRLVPFLGESVARLACVRWAIARASGPLLISEKPDVLILEMAERHLSMASPPGAPRSVIEAAKRGQ